MRNWRSLLATCLLLAAALLSVGCGQRFDYYLFTLSWSPEYCHSHAEASECTSDPRFGFIVHGLWPQFNNGRYPEKCAGLPLSGNLPDLSQIMPDANLIRHEWTTHGTCSGLAPTQYFTLIRRTFESIKIPDEFQSPRRTLTLSPAEIKQAFVDVNPSLTASEMAVTCPRNYLTGIEFCLSTAGAPIPCPANSVRDCGAEAVRVPPVR